MPFTAIVLAAAAACSVAVPYRLLQHGQSSPTFGVYQAALALGAVLGAQSPVLPPDLTRRPARGMAAGAFAVGGGMIVVCPPVPYLAVLAEAVTAGADASLLAVAQDCLVHSRTTASARGRTFAATACVTRSCPASPSRLLFPP